MTAPMTKSRKWLISGLILSLGLNLFLGGFLVTHMMRPDPFGIFPKIPLHQLIREMPEATREKAKAIMHERHPLMHQQFEAVKSAQDQLQQSIKADQVSREALNGAFDNLRHARGDLEQTLQNSFIDIILMLPPEERKNLALHWYQPSHRFSFLAGGKDPSGPPPPHP